MGNQQGHLCNDGTRQLEGVVVVGCRREAAEAQGSGEGRSSSTDQTGAPAKQERKHLKPAIHRPPHPTHPPTNPAPTLEAKQPWSAVSQRVLPEAPPPMLDSKPVPESREVAVIMMSTLGEVG